MTAWLRIVGVKVPIGGRRLKVNLEFGPPSIEVQLPHGMMMDGRFHSLRIVDRKGRDRTRDLDVESLPALQQAVNRRFAA